MSIHPRDNGPSEFLVLTNETSTLKIYLFGAHVTSWVVDGAERLWMSSCSVMDGSGPIRGGIPLAFPQFADEGSLMLHGFVRECIWEVTNLGPDSAELCFKGDSPGSRVKWDHAFVLKYTVRLLDSKTLQMQLRVENPACLDTTPFKFTGCFHTYLKFFNTSKVSLHGLHGTTYIDKCDSRKEKVQDGSLKVKDEADKSARDAGKEKGFVDRIYLNSPDIAEFKDEKGKVLYALEQSASWTDTTVYNPWLGDKQGPNFPDFNDDGYKFTICCEPTLSKAHAVTLRAGEFWEGYQRITVEP